MCHYRRAAAQLAGRASVALHTNVFFKGRVVVETALVMKVGAHGAWGGRKEAPGPPMLPLILHQSPPPLACAPSPRLLLQLRANGVVVLVPRFGLEGTVVLGAAAGDASARAASSSAKPKRALVYNEKAQTLAAADDPSLSLRIFQEVKVRAVAEGRGEGRRHCESVLQPPSLSPPPPLQVALFVEDRGRFRKQLAYRIVEPAWDALHAAAAAAGGEEAAAAAATQPASSGKAAAGVASAGTSAASPLAVAALEPRASEEQAPPQLRSLYAVTAASAPAAAAPQAPAVSDAAPAAATGKRRQRDREGAAAQVDDAVSPSGRAVASSAASDSDGVADDAGASAAAPQPPVGHKKAREA